MEQRKLKSPNLIYKQYVGAKVIPFSDFIEVENRKYKNSGQTEPFDKWINDRYSLIGKKAWFNTETSTELNKLGYQSEFSNLTAEQVKTGSDSIASIANSIGSVAGALKKNKGAKTTIINRPAKKGLSGGAIAGIVIGSVAVLGLITYAIVKNQK